MVSEVVSHLFEPRTARKRLGFGRSVSVSIVEAHGGRMWLSAQRLPEGAGSSSHRLRMSSASTSPRSSGYSLSHQASAALVAKQVETLRHALISSMARSIKTRVNLVLTPRRLPRLRHWGLAENLANKVLPPGSQRTSNSKVPCSLCMAFVCEGLARWNSRPNLVVGFFWSTALVLSRDLLHQLARPLAGPATLCDR